MKNEESETEQYTDEINLYDILQIIWKRKFLIIAIFLASVVAVAAISLYMTPKYRISTSLSPGWLDEKGGKTTYIDSAENISSSIKNGAYNMKIIESLNLNPEMYTGKIKLSSTLTKGSDIIQVNYDTENTEIGEQIVGELLNQLEKFYSKRVETRKEKIAKPIEILMKNQIPTINNKKARIFNDKKKTLSDMELEKRKLALLKDTEEKLNKQLKESEDNANAIVEQRTRLLKEGEKADTVVLLLYVNTIQQNIAYIDTLNSQINENRLNQELAKNKFAKMGIQLKDEDIELNDVETEILSTLQKVEDLKLKQEMVEGIRIIQKPTTNPHPVKPRKALNVAIAGITSLFLGIFLALFIEYIQKHRPSG